jgi:transposase
MRDGLFWLNDRQWARIEPHLPTGLTGPERDDDRRIISGIVHMLQSGARWRDCPREYGPYTTIYNRFNRWAMCGRLRVVKGLLHVAALVVAAMCSAFERGSQGRWP